VEISCTSNTEFWRSYLWTRHIADYCLFFINKAYISSEYWWPARNMHSIFHQADRVMRQFGFRQNIPTNPLNLDQLHREDMRGRIERNWPQYHAAWIAMWNDRYNRLIEGINFTSNGHLRDTTTYMEWYINHVIRYISPLQSSSDDDVSHLT